MKSQEKVKQQRRIKNIPILAHGFRMAGLLRPGLSTTLSQKAKRMERKHSMRNQSRKTNRP